ncbi:MAG: non-heme iron oxygenase ferredoxin subunit [Halobacteriales archaeon]|nr:non-heme iron oxygenase ferredoxin subunit [Halobacteriales archaeon]
MSAEGSLQLDVCALRELPPGTLKGVEAPVFERVCVANVDGELRAFGGICSHAYAELDNGFLREGRVMCPLHFSEFDTRTGEALSPPAEEPLPVFPVRVQDGRVVVELPA